MKKISFGKRMLSFALAAMMAASPFSPLASIAAAADYGLEFYDETTKIAGDNMDLVEGESIIVRANLPNGYSIYEPFFAAKDANNNDVANLSGIFGVATGVPSKSYTLTPTELPDGTNSAVYTLNALYTANVKEGSGTIYTDDGNFPITVTSAANIPITGSSTVTFEVSRDMDPDTANYLSFANGVDTADGYFSGKYDAGSPVSAEEIKGSGSKRTMRVIIQSNVGYDADLDLTVDLSGVPANYLFKAGDRFSISFRKDTFNPLTTRVISRETLVEEAALHVSQFPDTEGLTTTGESYIQLTGDETLVTIQNSFKVMSEVHRANVDVELEWDWLPDNPDHKKYIEIQTGAKYDNFSIVNRPEEDMTGYLSVQAIFRYPGTDASGKPTTIAVESKVYNIRVVFFGTGKPPYFKPLEKITGVQNGSDKKEDMTEWPAGQINMDLYNGSPTYAAAGFPAPNDPYKINSNIYFGEGRGRAEYAIINESSSGGEVELFISGSPIAYSYGSKISHLELYTAVEIRAKTEGQTTLTVEFYNLANELMANYTTTHRFYITDTTPSSDGTLASLDLIGTPTTEKKPVFEKVYPDQGKIDYGFDPLTNAYSITLPNCVESVTLTGRLPIGTGASEDIVYESATGSYPANTKKAGTASDPIRLQVDSPFTVRVTVTAQDGSENSYTLTLLRSAESNISTLSSLEAYRTDYDTDVNLVEGFAPNNLQYTITVPYSTEELRVSAIPESPWVTLTKDGDVVEWITDGSIKTLSLAQQIINFFTKEQTDTIIELNRPQPDSMNVYPPSATTTITARVTAENGQSTTTYTITVICLAPSTNTNLQSLSVTADGLDIPFEYVGSFNPALKDYLIMIPYSAETLVVTAQAEDDQNSKALEMDSGKYQNTPMPTDYKPEIPTVFTVKDIAPEKFSGDVDPNLNPFFLSLEVTAESGDITDPPYTIEVQRREPSDDNRLKSITLTDQDGKTVPTFSFNVEQLQYDIVVPYLTSQVTVTPVPNFPLAKVSVNEKEITSSKPSYTTGILSVEEVNVLEIVVTAEDFTERIYTIKVTREKASTEARLSALSAGGLKLEPKFNPNEYDYDVTIPEGTSGIAVTPTAVSPYATITVDGMDIASGATSMTFIPVDAYSEIRIVVTAQDGKTTKTYTLDITDENLIQKSSNADLYDLEFITGDLNPAFRPAIYDYEVYVKEDTYSVQIIPKKDNRYADMTVESNGREIGDYEGNYAISLFEDETEVVITVESQDKTVVNEYVINVFRGDEEKQGIYDPITAEEVDFEVPDPIIIDVSKYPLISAEVFNTLKTEYPEKTLLLVGNDYSFSMKGEEMDTLVPNTELFDFSISFRPPNEDDIWETITDLDSDNEGLDPVYIHFNHSGALPAAMKFTISLGNAYRNRELFWNYYNEPRDRIDYYGFVITNGKGTFSLPVSHMSTYIVTEERIYEAEDKVGGLAGYFKTADPEQLTAYYTSGKPNPNTGAR